MKMCFKKVLLHSSYKPIVEYIDAQFEAYLQEELKIKRSLFNYHDTRIHACLYFIAPTGHSLKSLDLVTMKKLDSKVWDVDPPTLLHASISLRHSLFAGMHVAGLLLLLPFGLQSHGVWPHMCYKPLLGVRHEETQEAR